MRITIGHKPVVNFLTIHLSKSKPSATEKSLNIASLRDTNNLELYRNKVEEYISHYNLPETPQGKWNNIVSLTINAAKKTVGYKSKTEIYQNPMIKHLSEKQKELKQQIKSTSCVKTIQNLKTQCNRILTTIHNELLVESQQRIEDTILNLESNPHDSRKMFTVVKQKKKKKIRKNTQKINTRICLNKINGN